MSIDIKEVLQRKEYGFIESDKHLGENILFLTLGGSHAYGTNTKDSDIDIRGICANKENELLGLDNFEQFINNEIDTTIYSINKVFQLFMNCNPNTIELLGCKEEHYSHVSDVGKLLLDNKHIFLSKKAYNSFGGYATSQLRRLQNALAHDRVSNELRTKHIIGSIDNSLMTLEKRYHDLTGQRISIDKDMNSNDILFSAEFNNYPLKDFSSIVSEISSILKTYDKLTHRNKKKDDKHLNKHAMHLVRLHLMLNDILEKKEIITYREDDLDLLMTIRNGYYMNDDGTYCDSFFEIIDELENKNKIALKNSKLSDKPNYNEINNFLIRLNKMLLTK